MAASNKKKHRYVNTRGRYRVGHADLSPCGARYRRQGACEKRVHKAAILGLPL